jgi:hypothetical protein
MLKKMEKCLHCFHNCKLETETNSKLLSCPKYLSKRSVLVQNMKGKGNVCPANYRL